MSPEPDKYAALICPRHGQVFLTQAEYIRQMKDVNEVWRCPEPNLREHAPAICGRICDFDDDYWEETR
jgi:hypothetical protein